MTALEQIEQTMQQGHLQGYRVGGRIMVSRNVAAEYVGRARGSLQLGEISDEEAANLVETGRHAR